MFQLKVDIIMIVNIKFPRVWRSLYKFSDLSLMNMKLVVSLWSPNLNFTLYSNFVAVTVTETDSLVK